MQNDMRMFYESWKNIEINSATAVAELTEEKVYYNLLLSDKSAAEAADLNINEWNKYILRDMLKADVYRHQGMLPNNFSNTISNSPNALKAVGMFKDEYLLDFINVEELAVRDYNNPMGAATYSIPNDVPEKYKSLRPIMQKTKGLLEKTGDDIYG